MITHRYRTIVSLVLVHYLWLCFSLLTLFEFSCFSDNESLTIFNYSAMATGYSVNLALTGGSFVEIRRNEIERMEIVGKGSYGKVYKAIWKGRCVAVKDIDTDTENEINAFRNELQQLSNVSHKNIVNFYGACTAMPNCCLVIEYAENGSLHNLLHNTLLAYTTARAIKWAQQCAEAIDYLHSMEPTPLVHRDLKPHHMLLFNDGQILKICDFRTVTVKATKMTKDTGSIPWMAPEVFASTELYSEKCDVYSFGIILWEIVHRKEPFRGMGCVQTLMAVYKGERPPIDEHCPISIKDLISACWDPSPGNRPTMKAVVEQLSHVNSNDPLPPPVENNRDEPNPSADTTIGKLLLNVNSGEPLPTHSQSVENRDEATNPNDVIAATPTLPPHSPDKVNFSSITNISTMSIVTLVVAGASTVALGPVAMGGAAIGAVATGLLAVLKCDRLRNVNKQHQ